MRITVNAGHYPGLDSGAVGATGLQEADVAKDIAKRVTGYLQAVGYDALFVQKNDLSAIVDASNAFGAQLFLSIHCNAAENRSAQGTETFAINADGAGAILAQKIQRQIVDNLGTVDRGVKTAGFYVLRYTDCSAVLVETAFISNPEDEMLLADPQKRDEFARAIARGVTDYFAGVGA